MLEGGLKGLAGPRTEAAHPLMEAPRPGDTEEEGDQTKEADWGQMKERQYDIRFMRYCIRMYNEHFFTNS